jgi:capsular polysaccharide transport system ATP-binding protein
MVRLENVTKAYRLQNVHTVVARKLNATFPSGRCVAVMGRNGCGKSTLLRMIGGTIGPDRGRIIREGAVSWPVGFSGSFHKDMTGTENVRFIARVYGIDTDQLIDFVEDFAELGDHFRMPVKTYSSGMRSRLSFGVSMGVPFDTYLVDEVSSVGDAAFKERAGALLTDRLTTKGAIIVTHSKKLVRQICDAVTILENGKLTWYGDIEDGIRAYRGLMGRGPRGPNKDPQSH